MSGHGFDTVVASMADVRDARLVIAATAETLDRRTIQEANRLRQFAVQLGVGDRASVVGTATRSDVTGLLRSADVVVTTPRQAPSGVFALEAMAHGVPVVASAVGALADAVVDGVTGRLALRELVANPARREAFGIAGADRVRPRYGWDRVVKDTVLVYQRVQFVRA